MSFGEAAANVGGGFLGDVFGMGHAKAQQQRQFDFSAEQAAINRRFTSGEAATQRDWAGEQAGISRDWQSGEAASARDFSRQEAITNRAFQERMSNTSFQRAMADIEAAGLSKIMMYGGQGAGTPSGAMGVARQGSGATASGSAASGTAASGTGGAASSQFGRAVSAAVSTALEKKRVGNQLKLIDKQVESLDEDVKMKEQNRRMHKEAGLPVGQQFTNIKKNIDNINAVMEDLFGFDGSSAAAKVRRVVKSIPFRGIGRQIGKGAKYFWKQPIHKYGQPIVK